MGILQKIVSRVKELFVPVREERKSRSLEEPQLPERKRGNFSTIPAETVENKRAFPKIEIALQKQPESRMLLQEEESWRSQGAALRERKEEAVWTTLEKAPADGRELSRQIEMESRRYCPHLEEDNW